ncbi:multi antimicrobial extrusion protein MatE [Phocaeicola salanitronis DSM 18170]|uniref:Multi antimicrobial extrusion protein MatE n=1 Tax=Phocaeicola salanitronis (strain DSM 18170 / JCM 13657 / CCUG 60908 / BL78) TaxID=667015 RepID=F0R6W9_PHOSB|nr:MATE family efflux transporter [Phocaeicola salanitronis]ADY34886.1 multi antimicrobial extrusion protein MatE [Phocaeicola salanitronis DSM 18170]
MAQSNKENSKRIAKNTLLLYIRLIFTMAVGLFTSRVILATLGVEDYGVYNVVAGFVMMFSFFTSSLGAAISRFLTYELGKGESGKLQRIFSTSVNVQLLLSLAILILAEAIGVWFVNHKLNIPADRLYAANWAFQCAILSFIFNLISVPYNAAIIAHERMSAFAYISILEVTLKLAIVYVLYISPIDKLITYSILFAFVGLVIRLVYGGYCRKHFAECRYQTVIDKTMLKEITGFAGWNLLGSGAYLFNTQGVNIVMNLFFGVTVNAARGIATQVEGVVRQFVTNFTTALNPQITKSYAAGNMEYMYTLVCRGAKYSYFLMLVFAVPFMFEADIILKLWLDNVPEYTSIFLRLTMVGTLCDVLGNSTANACWATGKVKKYYLCVGSIGSLVFFISYGLFAFGFPAYTSYVVFIVIYIILIFVKLYLIKGLIDFPVAMFYKETLLRILPVTVCTFMITSFSYGILEESTGRMLFTVLLSTIALGISTFLFGLEQSERQIVKNKIVYFKKRFL